MPNSCWKLVEGNYLTAVLEIMPILPFIKAQITVWKAQPICDWLHNQIVQLFEFLKVHSTSFFSNL